MVYDPTGVNYVMNLLQAATYLGVPSSVIDDLVKAHMIPFTQVGDRTVFSKAALDQGIFAKSMENLHEDLPAAGFSALHGSGS